MPDAPVIDVDRLTRAYPGRVAVDSITFSVGRGEVVGFLGPNGAGKTTTMRILSGFLPPSRGVVRIAGYDITRDADEVRRRIGYMPENNPLHLDMRVREYLIFRARLKGLGWSRSRSQADQVMKRCGLSDVGRRIIGHLSKGFRQRIGIADAIIHEPDLIILDEPTIGLDPHQIRSVRELIRELGQQHTVLISTHILSEVEMTCSRVLILNQGRITASDTPMGLEQKLGQTGKVVAEIAAPEDELVECLSQKSEVAQVDLLASDGEFNRVLLTPGNGDADLRSVVYGVVRDRNWSLRELTRQRHSLEDIFVQLTQNSRPGRPVP